MDPNTTISKLRERIRELEEQQAGKPPMPPALQRTFDALVKAVDANSAFSVAEVMAAAKRDAGIRARLVAADADDPIVLGRRLGTMAKAGAVERFADRAGSRGVLWRVPSGVMVEAPTITQPHNRSHCDDRLLTVRLPRLDDDAA